MAKRASKSKPICQIGDRICAPGGKWGTVTSTSHTSIIPYKVRWDNGHEATYKKAELERYQIHSADICREEGRKVDVKLSLPVGTRCKVINPGSPESVTAHEWIVDGFTTASSLNGDLDLIIIKRFTDDNGLFTTRSFEAQWLCKILEPAESLKVKEDSAEQLSLLEGLTGESQLSATKMRSQSSNPTSTIKSSPQTSEISLQPQANTMQLSGDFPVLEHQKQALVKDLITQNQLCLESSFGASAKPNLNSPCLNNLWDLSIEDLERGWEDSRWQDTKASIRSSLDAINLERSIRGTESLSFPTLLSGRGRGCRDAGLVKCEKWWKQHVIQEIGLQLSAEAIALLHGFPANWYRSISPLSVAQPDTQDDLQPESLEVKPSPSPKLELPLNGLNGCGQSFPREWQIGDRIELVEMMEFNRRKLGETGTVTEVRKDGAVPRFIVTWDKKRPKLNNTTMFSAETKSVQLIDQYPAAHQSAIYSSEKLKSEEELTPVDDSAVGKHYWCDRDTVAVEVLSVQNWRETPRSPIIKIAQCRPWWTHENRVKVRADVIVIPLSELTELEEDDFFSLIPERSALAFGNAKGERSSASLSLVEDASPLQKCPSCDQSLISLDDGCGICGWTSSLQKSEIHTERACQTGSLYKDTKWQETKLGRVEYPRVDVRDPDNDDHWYWYLSYVVKDSRHKKASAKGNGGFKDCTAYVPRSNLPLVRSLIRHSVPVEVTLEVVGLKFCWLDFKGSWAIGEVKPEVCPQLCLISMDEKQVLIIPSSEWGELRVEARAAKRRVINEAIAENKNLTYIKEKLDAQRVPETDHRAVSSTRTD